MNEAVGKRNCIDELGGKRRLVQKISNKEFWKCIECIILEVYYGKKGHKIWRKTNTSAAKKVQSLIDRDVHGKTDSLKVCCDIYCHNYSFLFH